MAPKQAPRTNCLSTKLVPVTIPVPRKQSNWHAVCLFGTRYVPPRYLLAPPNVVWKLKKYSILAPGSLSASFSSRRTSTPPSYLLFLWFSDCVGFCQIEQTKPVEKTPQKTGHADSGWGANATRSLNHLSKALIYGENKRRLFNTEQEESALGTDKRRKMPDSFWIWT